MSIHCQNKNYILYTYKLETKKETKKTNMNFHGDDEDVDDFC